MMYYLGLSEHELADAVGFYQKYKREGHSPTFKATLKQIKRENLEIELRAIEAELRELENE